MKCVKQKRKNALLLNTSLSLFRGQTLRAVTEGKIHVELERARLTRQLAKIRESEGKVAEAADLMAEVQVCIYTYEIAREREREREKLKAKMPRLLTSWPKCMYICHISVNVFVCVCV